MGETLKKAQDSLRIKSINLRECKIKVDSDIEVFELKSMQTQSQAFKAVCHIQEVTFEKEDRQWYEYSFHYAVGVRLVKKEFLSDEVISEDDKPLIEIFGVFDARYNSANKLIEDELDSFSENNVGYHVWPYWREFVQSSCMRVGLNPPIEIPMYRLSSKK